MNQKTLAAISCTLFWHSQQLVDITSHRLIYAMTNLIILKIVSKIYILSTILSTNIS